ncbi:4363_t:CDS:2 [Funneliformis geosporum]|nr:4363_t:CDS:2 [Funneliformis geosporum]
MSDPSHKENDPTSSTSNELAYILSKYIVNILKNDATFRENISNAAPFSEIRFLELGSGCGLVGLSAWILGGFVVCTDLPGEEIKHTKLNIKSNVELILKQQERFNSESNLKKKNKLDVGLRSEDINVFPLNCHLPCDTIEERKENRRTLVLGIYKDRGLGETAFFDIANKFGKMKVIWIDNNWMIKEFNDYSQEYKMFWLIPFE